MNTLLSSFVCSDNSLTAQDCCDSNSLGGILKINMPKCLADINDLLRKSESLDIKTLFSFCDNLKTCLSGIDLGDNLTSCPSLDKNLDSPMWTFSSNKNLILDREQILPSNFCGKFQSRLNMLFSQGRISFYDFFSRGSSLQHFQNSSYHNSCAFKSRLSMADFGVNNNVFVNFDSHSNIDS